MKEQSKSEGGRPAEERLERCGDGEYGVEVGHRQKRLFLRFRPKCLIEAATAGAVTVSARVVGEAGIAALVAFLEVTPEFSSAAGDEVADDAGLLTTEPEGSRVVSKNLSDPDLALTTRVVSAAHYFCSGLCSFSSRSSGLWVSVK